MLLQTQTTPENPLVYPPPLTPAPEPICQSDTLSCPQTTPTPINPPVVHITWQYCFPVWNITHLVGHFEKNRLKKVWNCSYDEDFVLISHGWKESPVSGLSNSPLKLVFKSKNKWIKNMWEMETFDVMCKSVERSVVSHYTLTDCCVVSPLVHIFTLNVIFLFRRAELNLHSLPCSQWPTYTTHAGGFYNSLNRTRQRENLLCNNPQCNTNTFGTIDSPQCYSWSTELICFYLFWFIHIWPDSRFI